MVKKNIDMASRLRDLRGSRTLRGVARAVGCSPSSLLLYESGRIPDFDTGKHLADFYRVTMEYLLTGAEGLVPAVNESITEYTQLDKGQKQLVNEIEELLLQGGDNVKQDLRVLLDIVRRARGEPDPSAKAHQKAVPMEDMEATLDAARDQALGALRELDAVAKALIDGVKQVAYGRPRRRKKKPVTDADRLAS